jgi:hypothetical protein
MPHLALAPLIGPEFDKFLGASIGAGRNGTMVSVLSALARLDVDPWQEAAALARMPREAATKRLTALIAALPRESSAELPSQTIAGDLVALLPRAASFNVALPESVFAAAGLPRPEVRFALSALAIVVAIAFALSVGLSPKPGAGPRPSASPVEDATTVLPR